MRYRSIEQQNALYAKGRTTAGSIVTKVKGGYSFHNHGLAFDLVPLVNGNPSWNVSRDVWERLGNIGKSLGLERGGDWKSFRDYPHYQYTFGLTTKKIMNGAIIPAFPSNIPEVLSTPVEPTITINAPKMIDVSINGVPKDLMAVNIEGRNYVSISEICKLFGFTIEWDDMSKSTSIETLSKVTINVDGNDSQLEGVFLGDRNYVSVYTLCTELGILS